jgi:hypothetical protein
MSLDIKDGNGVAKKLFTTITGSGDAEHMPHHIIQDISGSSIQSVIEALNQISSSVKSGGSVQTITASYQNPVPITGSINVDVQISDLITVTSSLANPLIVGLYGSNNNRAFIDSNGAQLVTSSNTAPVYVSASLTNPVGITGSTTVNNLTQTSHNTTTYSGLLTPIGLVGTSGNRAIIDSSGAQIVTSSVSSPIYVSSSLTNPIGVTGSATINNLAFTNYNASTYTSNVNAVTLVGSSSNRVDVDSYGSQKVGIFGSTNNRVSVDSSGSLTVTSSYINPLVVTASFLQPLATKTSSSNSDFQYVRNVVPTGTIRNVFSTSNNTINFNDLTNFGAFQICSNNINRKGLTISNPTSQRLFIAIATQASSSDAGRNGFDLNNNSSDPNSYSFIIYPSGSYFADSTNSTLFYGGYFVSSSNSLRIMVTETY